MQTTKAVAQNQKTKAFQGTGKRYAVMVLWKKDKDHFYFGEAVLLLYSYKYCLLGLPGGPVTRSDSQSKESRFNP